MVYKYGTLPQAHSIKASNLSCWPLKSAFIYRQLRCIICCFCFVPIVHQTLTPSITPRWYLSRYATHTAYLSLCPLFALSDGDWRWKTLRVSGGAAAQLSWVKETEGDKGWEKEGRRGEILSCWPCLAARDRRGGEVRGRRSCFEKTGAPCEGNERTQAHSEAGRDTEGKKNRGREKSVCVCVEVPERGNR